ncbi:hypothetical protein RCL1_008501 [Eukaryota sp. TZLM3-RCL]
MIEFAHHASIDDDISALDFQTTKLCIGTHSGVLIDLSIDKSRQQSLHIHKGVISSICLFQSSPLVLSASLDGTLKLSHFPFGSSQSHLCCFPKPIDRNSRTVPSPPRSIYTMSLDENRKCVVAGVSDSTLSSSPCGTSILLVFSVDTIAHSLTLLHSISIPFPSPLSSLFVPDEFTSDKFIIGHSGYLQDQSSCLILDSSSVINNKPILPDSTISPSSLSEPLHVIPPVLGNSGRVPVVGGMYSNRGFVRFCCTNGSSRIEIPYPVTSICNFKLTSGDGVLVTAMAKSKSIKKESLIGQNSSKFGSNFLSGVYLCEQRHGLLCIKFPSHLPGLQAIKVVSRNNYVLVVAKLIGNRRSEVFLYKYSSSVPVTINLPLNLLIMENMLFDSVVEMYAVKNQSIGQRQSIFLTHNIDPLMVYAFPPVNDKITLNVGTKLTIFGDFVMKTFIKSKTLLLAYVGSQNLQQIFVTSSSNLTSSVFSTLPVVELYSVNHFLIAFHSFSFTVINMNNEDLIPAAVFFSGDLVNYSSYNSCLYLLTEHNKTLSISVFDLENNGTLLDNFVVNIPYNQTQKANFSVLHHIYCFILDVGAFIVRRITRSDTVHVSLVDCFPTNFVPFSVFSLEQYFVLWSNHVNSGSDYVKTFAYIIDMMGKSVISPLKGTGPCSWLGCCGHGLYLGAIFSSTSNPVFGVFNLDRLTKTKGACTNSVVSKFTADGEQGRFSSCHLRLVPKTLYSTHVPLSSSLIETSEKKVGDLSAIVDIEKSNVANKLLKRFSSLNLS